MNHLFSRHIRDHWYVSYNKNGYPHVQQGWILPPNQSEAFDPFIVMADDWFKRGTFSDHPHRGFQTITYVIDGRLEHTDNQGGYSVLDSGDVQYMNAGFAARHAEEAFDDDLIHTLQLWLNLPKALKRTEASYQDVRLEEAPVLDLDKGYVRVYSGSIAGLEGPLKSEVPITMTEIFLEEGGEYTLELPANHNGHLYMLQGEISFGEEEPVTLAKTGVGLLSYDAEAHDQDSSTLKLKAKTRGRVLIYTGKPLNEEVITHGPFVMNTQEEIKEAVRDFQAGRFGPSSQ